ncbi:MAG: DNA polymerase I [Anaerolineae bacterium]
MAQPKLILIDGHSLAYRAYFAAARAPQTFSVKRDDGTEELTGATYFFTNMVLKVWKDEQPDYIAVAFDVGRTFRDDLYAEYKGTREKMPDDLSSQLPRIQQMVAALGMPIFTADGFEADDVLGTLARQASGQGMRVIIVTGDRDSLQLVNPSVNVLTSKQRFDDVIIYDEALVKENYGVRPDQLIDYKAMLGDTSDNVPGVRGVGEKTAQTLLQTYGTLDNIYAHLDEVKPARAQSSLRDDKANAYLSKTLVTIKTDVPLSIDWEACKAEVDQTRALALLRELKVESMIKRLPGGAASAEKTPPAPTEAQPALFDAPQEPSAPQTNKAFDKVPTQTRLVDGDPTYRELLAQLNAASIIAFDTETTSTDVLRGELVGMSFCVKPNEAWYVPCASTGGDGALPLLAQAQEGWQLDPTSAKFEPFMMALRRKDARLIVHNAKFDIGVLKALGYPIDRPVIDTMLAQFLIDPASPLGLKQMAYDRLGWQMTEISELIGKGKKQITMRDVPVAQVAPYAAADADATFQLWQAQEPELRAKNQEALFYNVELPLIPVLLDMEFDGVALDVKYLSQLSSEINERLRHLEKEIYELSGQQFNINSPKQLGDVLFGKLQLPVQSKTSTGAFSTNIEVLESLKDKHVVIAPIIEHRELSKLQGTYVDALPALINPKTGRLHTDFNQAGAITGRMSSSNPNLQNIPIKTEMGRRVRKAFIPRKGWRLISADYSQVELRILAHLADDPTLKGAFERGEDIHASTASAIYDTPLAQVSPMQRMFAKRVNFGIAYGMGAFALSQNTGMSMGEAQEFITKYFARFPRVKAWLDGTRKLAAEQGYVETVLGRRRYFPELRPSAGASEMLKRRAEREAINHPVQGSAADIMKIAMIAIHRALQKGGYQARMTLQVHDELVFDCPPAEVEAVSALVKREMEGAYPLSVVLRADVGDGPNWEEM